MKIAVAADKVELKLLSLAKEVCIRLDKADRCASQAEDHRLSAAIRLAEARKIADENGIGWKAWVADNVPGRSYRDVKRLVAIGRAKDPKLALEAAREKKAAESRGGRAEKRLVIAASAFPLPEGLSVGDVVSFEVPPTASVLEQCQDTFSRLDYDQKKEFLEWAAAEMTEEELPLDFERYSVPPDDEETDGPGPSVGGISDEDLLDIPQHLRRI